MLRLLLVFLLAVSCASSPSGPVLNARDQGVLEAVVDDPKFSQWAQCYGSCRAVLLDRTMPPAMENGEPFFMSETELASAGERSLPLELLNALKVRNRRHVRLGSLRTSLPIVDAENSKVAARGANYYVWLSLPGYSDDGARAAVAVTKHAYAPCCGAGYIALLKWNGSKWLIGSYPDGWVE